jgi:hypothetical protein
VTCRTHTGNEECIDYGLNCSRKREATACLLTLMMETVNISETSVSFCIDYYTVGSIVSDYGLDNPAIGVRSPAGAKEFSSSLCVQTGSGAHPAFYPMGTGGPFPGGKAWPGCVSL